jgi:hypothetical protein
MLLEKERKKEKEKKSSITTELSDHVLNLTHKVKNPVLKTEKGNNDPF